MHHFFIICIVYGNQPYFSKSQENQFGDNAHVLHGHIHQTGS
jgi:hypothetical protein